MEAAHHRMLITLREFLSGRRIETKSLPRDVARILRCVHEHAFLPDFNVTSARRLCGIRNNNISARFRNLVGVGLRGYIEDLRLDAARRLLETDSSEIYLIGMAVGYEHPETFHRAFYKRHQMTPRQYRRRAMGRASSRR